MSKPESEALDLEDRDPQQINQHIEVTWEELIGEPQTIRSPECAWSLSQRCFKYSRLCMYTFVSVLCAPIAACIMGVSYALFYFQYIWCTIPSLWIFRACCGITNSFVQAFTHGCLIPIMQGFGQILSQIKVRTGSIEQYENKREDEKILIV